jgi:WD40 repeat protein
VAALGLSVALTKMGLPAAGGEAQASRGPAGLLRGHTGPVHVVRFTRDGQRLISASGWPGADQSLRVWDLATRQELFRLAMPGNVGCLDLTPDDQVALVGLSSGVILRLELETGQVIGTLKGHGGAVGWVAFAPDGAHAFSAAADATARWWGLNGKLLGKFPVQDRRARGGAVFPDGRRLLTGDGGGRLQIWEVATGQEIRQANPIRGPFIDSITLLLGKQALVTGVGGVSLYDLETGQMIRRFQTDDPERDEVSQAVRSPDGRWLLTGSFDGKVRYWDFETGELSAVVGSLDNFVWSVAISPDGRLAASGSGAEKQDGKIVSGSDFDIRLWDLTNLGSTASLPPETGGARFVIAGIFLVVVTLFFVGVWFYTRQRRLQPGKQIDEPRPVASIVIADCPGCGASLKARPTLAGKKVKCPQCGSAVQVPKMPAGSTTHPVSPGRPVAPKQRD